MAPPNGPLRPQVFNIIPIEIRKLQQWVSWWSVAGANLSVHLPSGSMKRFKKGQTKARKLPVNPSTGGLASTTRSSTWSSCETAISATKKWSLTGIGFVFTDADPYTGVDIDGCRDPVSGELARWAKEIVDALDSYTEVSPSGIGVHIIVRGTLPSGHGNQKAINGGKIEMFCRSRYFTFTGELLAGTRTEIHERQSELTGLHTQLFTRRPSSVSAAPKNLSAPSATPTTDAELILRARDARNGLKFQRLWNGQWEADYPSQSEADLALCYILAFWTESNFTRVDELFRQSGLMRDKWNVERYRERTITRAMAETSCAHPRRREAKGRPIFPSRVADGESEAESRVPDLLSFPYTDTGNAERLTAMFGPDIRFCSEVVKWFVWDGRRWCSEDTRRVKTFFKKTIRETYKQAVDLADKDQRELAEKHARQSEAAQRIRAALECAECEDAIRISATDFDKQPFLLNCKNGKLDLQTGNLRAHDRTDLITKIVQLNYRADAACPQFLRFLHRIMGDQSGVGSGDRVQRLVAYLQKCFGYALTGDVSEKAIFCFFGTGNNGKTTLLEVIRFILSEYSGQVLIDSLMAHQGRETSTSAADLVDLWGARFVTTSEAERGQRLAVAKLKYLTAGMGDIKACRKYENPIVFEATHKLFLDANHRPVVPRSEPAIFNRLKPIPFLVTIPPEEIDRNLLDKLKAESEGILAWMVKGCLRWQREGLGEPPEIIEALSDWQAESDRFRLFLDECYTWDPKGFVPVSNPWSSYQLWCEVNREENRLTKTEFDEEMERSRCKRGFRENGTQRVWVGIRIQKSFEDLQTGRDEVTGE